MRTACRPDVKERSGECHRVTEQKIRHRMQGVQIENEWTESCYDGR